MGLLSIITSAITNKSEVRERLRQNINDLKRPTILGFSLLSEEEQESYLDRLADVIAGREYSLIAAANWLISSPSTADIMTEIQEKIRLAAAKKVLENMNFHLGDDKINIERNLPYVEKQKYILAIARWFKENPLELANASSIDYTQGKLFSIFENAQKEVIKYSQNVIKRNLDTFDVGFEIFEKVVTGELLEEVDFADNREYFTTLLGISDDKYFDRAHLKFIETLTESFDDPRYHRLSEIINDGHLRLGDILRDFKDEEFEIIKDSLNNIFSRMYMAQDSEFPSIKDDLKKLLNDNYLMILETAESVYAHKDKERKINDIFSRYDVEMEGDIDGLIKKYDDLYEEREEFAFGFSLLTTESKEKFFIEYSSLSSKEPVLLKEIEDNISEAIRDKKIDLLHEIFDKTPDVNFTNIDSFLEVVSSNSELEELSWPFSDDITVDEIKNILYDEGRERSIGFALLSPEAKKESIMLLIEDAIRGKEIKTSMEAINNKIQEQVKEIIREHKVDILGHKYHSYDLLDRDGVDEFSDDSFKKVAREGFLRFYQRERSKGLKVEGVVDLYLNSANTTVAELDRTAKRFHLIKLSDEIDDNLYEVFVSALLQNSGLKDPFSSYTGESVDIVSRYTNVLKKHIDVPLSKYLRVALDNGASIEGLFRGANQSVEDAKKDINERLKVGFSAIDLVSGSGYTTLNTMLETILLKARDNATRYLEDKANKVVREFLKENVYWLEKDNIDLIMQNYVEHVLTGNKDFGKWSVSITNVVKIAKARKLSVLDDLKDEMDLYNIDVRKKASILKMAEKEIFGNLKSGIAPSIEVTLNYLRKKYSLKKIRKVSESGGIDQVEVADLDEFSRILANKEESFRKIDVDEDDNVRLNKAHVAMSAGKRAVEKKALEHYFDLMFETVIGMERLSKLDYLKDDEQIHLQMLGAMHIPIDKLEELKGNKELYEHYKAKFITYKIEDLDITDNDNRIQVSLKSRIYRLEAKQEQDYNFKKKTSILHRGPINKRIKEREKELTRLYLELQYENQRALFAKFSKDFDRDVKKPILQEGDTNKHIVAFVSAIGQSLKSTATFDFGAAAANIAYNMSDKWEERKVSFAEAVLLGKVHDIADSLIGSEVEKEVGKLFRSTSKQADMQLHNNARALEQLDDEKLMPDQQTFQFYTMGSDRKATAIVQGFMDLIKRTCLGKTSDIPNQTVIKHALYKTYASIVTQAEEAGAILLDALKVMDKNKIKEQELSAFDSLKGDLEQYLSEIVEISEEMNSLEVRRAIESNLEKARKIFEIRNKLDSLAESSKEPTLIGLATTFNAVAKGGEKIDGILSKVSKLILDNASEVEGKISSVGVGEGSWKEILLLNLQSILVEQGMGLGLARDKVMLKKYVTHMLHEHGDPDFKTHKIKNTEVMRDIDTLPGLAESGSDTKDDAYSFGGDSEVEEDSFNELVAKAQENIDEEIKNTTPFNENANSNNLVRGLFKFLNKVVYFFKHGRLPPSNLLISQRVREVNNMFQAKFHEERAKSKVDVMLNISRLMSTMGEASSVCKEYAKNLSGRLTSDSKLYTNYLCDETDKISLSMFPEIDLKALKSKYVHKRKKDYIGFQRELEEQMNSIDPERYNKYMEQIQSKIPSRVYSNEGFMKKIQEEDFKSRKRVFANYKGDIDDLRPKELKGIMRQYNLVCQEQNALIEMKKEKRKSAWFRFISFFKTDRYTEKIRDFEKQKDFLLSKMVSCEVDNSFKEIKKDFVETVEAKEFPKKFDPLTLKDQKTTALVAVKHMFEKVGQVGVRHLGIDAADKLINRDGKVKVKGLIADIVNLGINIPSEKKFRKLVEKGAASLTFSEYEDEMSYIKKLSESFESSIPQVVKIDGVDDTWHESRDKYSQWLQSADRNEEIRKELERLGEIKPERPLFEQIFVDSIKSLSSKVQGGLALKTSLMRYSSIFLKKVELDPSSIDNTSLDTFFGAVKESFVDQRILNLKAALELVGDKPDDPWVIENKEVFDVLKKIQSELKDLDKIKRQLAEAWNEGGLTLSIEQKKDIFEQLARVRELKIKYGSEISKELNVLCRSAPKTDNIDLVEGFCFIGWSESYIQFYGDIFEKVHLSADELLQQREIVNDSRFETRGSESSIQKGLAGMFEGLGEMISNRINAVPIEQLHSYMARQELKDLDLEGEHDLRDEILAREAQTKTIRSVLTSDGRIGSARNTRTSLPSPSSDDAEPKLR